MNASKAYNQQPVLLLQSTQELNAGKGLLHSSSAQWSTISTKPSSVTSLNETDFYNQNSFCTVLNKTKVCCCSRKKPDEFLRDLLFKLLKYGKNFMQTGEVRDEELEPKSA